MASLDLPLPYLAWLPMPSFRLVKLKYKCRRLISTEKLESFIFLRCQHCAPTLATTSPTPQLRQQRRRVSGRLEHNTLRFVKVFLK